MRRIGLALLMVVGVAATAAAQAKPQTRQGLNVSFGLGAGSGGVKCTDCASDRQNGGTGYFRLGGTVSPQLVVGGELSGWTHSEDAGDVTFSYITAFAQYYPVVTSGFFVKGGLGFGGTEFNVQDPTLGNIKLESQGLAGSVGAGYDIRLGKNFSLSPYVEYMSTFGAPAKVNGQDAGGNLNGNVVAFGLGFTWH